jgi:ribA/ribD-fused uncharacterized protein
MKYLNFMTEWGFEEFRREMEKAEQRMKNHSLEEDDTLTRNARFMEARNTYETISPEERELSLFKYRTFLRAEEKFTFFWATKSPFSQWHRSTFKGRFINVWEPKNRLDNAEYEFTSAEQYMMYSKAMLFLDRDTANKILRTRDVKEIKHLGREVKYFNEIVWDFNKIGIVYEGNKAKFTQNKILKEVLFATKGTTLVEAAPNDSIWGIGLAEADPRAKKRETWQGKNLLGEILTQLRVDLMGEY